MAPLDTPRGDKPARINLKHPSRWITTASERDRRYSARDEDMTQRVINYMLERGAFKSRLPLRLHGDNVGSHVIAATVEKLPWNPAAPARIVALTLYELVDVYSTPKRGRGVWLRRERQKLETVKIPHWDYDGVDPLVAREPWERADINREMDHQARYRREDSGYDFTNDWRRESEVHNLECAEELAEEGNAIDLAECYARSRLEGEAPL
jgi:hypothetical protein